jgi:hypothetical protein
MKGKGPEGTMIYTSTLRDLLLEHIALNQSERLKAFCGCDY